MRFLGLALLALVAGGNAFAVDQKPLVDCDIQLVGAQTGQFSPSHVTVSKGQDGVVSFSIKSSDGSPMIIVAGKDEGSGQVLKATEDTSWSENDPNVREAAFDNDPQIQSLSLKIWTGGFGVSWAKRTLGRGPDLSFVAACPDLTDGDDQSDLPDKLPTGN